MSRMVLPTKAEYPMIIGQSCVQIGRKYTDVPNDSLNYKESLWYFCTILIFRKQNAVSFVFTGPCSHSMSSTVTDKVGLGNT